MLFVSSFEKKSNHRIHHDLNNESRIVKILIGFTKFLNSKYVIKIITITNGIKNEYLNKKYIDENKTLLLPSGSSIKNNFRFNLKAEFKIGYFGSLYKSRGVDLILKLSKIDKKNKYFLYGDLKNVSKSKLKNVSKNLKLKTIFHIERLLLS